MVIFGIIFILIILIVLVWCLARSSKLNPIDREDSDNAQMKELSKLNNTKLK